MDLRDYAAALRRHWIFTLLAILLLGGLGVAYRGFSASSYEATAEIFVSPGGSATSNNDLSAGTSYAQALVSSYVGITSTPVVLDQVIKQLNLDTTASDLAAAITVTNPPTSLLIDITAKDSSPGRAAAIANATAASLQSAATAYSPQVGSGTSSLQLVQVQPATAPLRASGPGVAVYGVLGALIGFVLALGIAVLVELFNVRIRSGEDARAVTSNPVLGEIPDDSAINGTPLIVHAVPMGRSAEAFRALRTNLQYAADRPQVLTVTSAMVREGKTSTALNLALSIADTGHSVILVDADLRASRLGRILSLDEHVGLADVLLERAGLRDAITRFDDIGIDVLGAGTLVATPAELLQLQGMADLVRELRHKYTYVVIDTPALLPVSDGAIIARLTDGALVVCSARRTKKAELRGGLAVLDRVGAAVLGVVMVSVRPQSDLRYPTRTAGRLKRARPTAASVAAAK